MVRTIVKDIFFLGQKSEPATKSDISVGKDLQDTLEVNRAGCVGMAANMIGIKKRGRNFLWHTNTLVDHFKSDVVTIGGGTNFYSALGH